MTRRPRLPSLFVAASLVLAGGLSLAASGPASADIVTSETADGGYTPVTPARILDTRYAIGPISGPIGAGRSIDLQIDGRGGVSAANVSAVVINITVVNPTAKSGFLTIYPSGTSRPVVSSINWTAARWVGANLVTVPVGSNGKITIYNSGGSTNVVGDVMGYYRSATAAPSTTGAYGSYLPADTPTRLYDSREKSFNPSGLPLAPYSYQPVCVTFNDPDVEAHTKALVVNVTATAPAASGYLAAWDGLETDYPSTSTLNFVKGQTVANMAVVPTSLTTSGVCTGLPTIAVANGSAGATHIIVDLVGIYDDNQIDRSSHDAFRYRAVTPTRIVDSRKALGMPTLGPKATGTVTVPGSFLTPYTGGIIANLTDVQPTAANFLTVWPPVPLQPMPVVSNLNAAAHAIVANMMVTGLTDTAGFNVYNGSAGSTNVLVDVVGTLEYYDVQPSTAAAGRPAKAPLRAAPVPGNG